LILINYLIVIEVTDLDLEGDVRYCHHFISLFNHISDVIVSMLASSVVDHGFNRWSGTN